MAGEPAPAVVVALLGQHDLVDEPARHGVGRRAPGHVDAAEVALQGLEQRHEVPHGEDVVLHEQAQGPHPANLAVEGMVEEGHLQQPGGVLATRSSRDTMSLRRVSWPHGSPTRPRMASPVPPLATAKSRPRGGSPA